MSILPSWARRFGKFGLVVVSLGFVMSVILEEEIQSWWKVTAKPFLNSPVPIEIYFTFITWQLLILVAVMLLAVLVISYAMFSKLRGEARNINQTVAKIPLPEYIGARGKLDSTHVTNAIIDAEKGKISRETLAEIVIMAANSNVISKPAAIKSLESFQYELVELSTNKFAYADAKKVIRR